MRITLANKTHPTHILLFLPILPADVSPPNGDDKGLGTNNVQEFEAKIYKEYAAAQDHEGIHKYTNVTIEEFLMGKSLQQITFSSFCYLSAIYNYGYYSVILLCAYTCSDFLTCNIKICVCSILFTH